MTQVIVKFPRLFARNRRRVLSYTLAVLLLADLIIGSVATLVTLVWLISVIVEDIFPDAEVVATAAIPFAEEVIAEVEKDIDPEVVERAITYGEIALHAIE